MFKIIAFFIITLFARLFVGVGILLTRGKHLHDRIISLRGEVWAPNTSLSPPLFIKVPVPGKESERSCICGLVVLILYLSAILILELFRQCGIFCFSFYWANEGDACVSSLI
jgi:hypothetical protein